MVLNFNRPLPGAAATALVQLQSTLSAGTASQRQTYLAQVALDYSGGRVLAGVTLPSDAGAIPARLDDVVVSDDAADVLTQVLRSETDSERVAYLQAFADDLSSPVKGRRVVALCALICFLLREAA